MAPFPFYDRMILSPLTDLVCSLGPITENRRKVAPLAEGVVLEPGIGSGLNLAHYDPEKVKHVIGVDPNRELLKLARRRVSKAPVSVEMLEQSAETLPLEDNSVDTVLLTYTGCSIPDVARALGEFRRVLKPAGRLLFCEHGRSHEERVARFQDAVNPWWRPLAGGCNVNRDVESLLTEAGFDMEKLERFYAMPRPKFLAYHYLGAARAR